MRFTTPRLVLMFCLLLALPVQAVFADQDKPLEDWQKKLLEALEKSQGGDDTPTRQGYAPGSLEDPGALQAAAAAQERHGGQVLAVVRVGSTYRVRLLLDNGRVMTAVIRD